MGVARANAFEVIFRVKHQAPHVLGGAQELSAAALPLPWDDSVTHGVLRRCKL